MRLRAQLAVFATLTLVLPWAGWQTVRQIEQALRGGLEQSLLASAGTVAAAIGTGLPEPSDDATRPLYASRLAVPPEIDGFPDDWSSAADAAVELDGGHRFMIGVDATNLYLFVDVVDDDPVYPGRPGATPYGDRLLLSLGPAELPRRWVLLQSRAPGQFRARVAVPPAFVPQDRFDDRIVGARQDTPAGYAIEARMPLAAVGGAFGVAVIDVDRHGDGYSVHTSPSWDVPARPWGRLVHEQPALRSRLAAFTQAGERFRVVDADGYVLADVGGVGAAVPAERSAGPLDALIRYVLRNDDPDYRGLENPPGRLGDAALRRALDGTPTAAWYGRGQTQSAVVAAAVPLPNDRGAVVLERASDPILTLTNRAYVRLVALTVAAGAFAALALLGYASWLSFRVRRLARAAEGALGPRGEIRAAMPGGDAGDEIGDLARSFTGLLGRLREYTDYQRSLTGKLSHELRTPLAVISTSLDNLAHEADGAAAAVYLERLRDGARRLDGIVAAMSEATRIEQAIQEAAPRRFELAPVVEACARAYADVHTDRRIDFAADPGPTGVVGSGDLIAQMLDKLVDNAVDFSPAGSTIAIRVTGEPRELLLSVTNEGSRLPESMRAQLFDSLVSLRAAGEGGVHLGLGLHIVALIAEFHGGRADAVNVPQGVAIRIRLPRAPG